MIPRAITQQQLLKALLHQAFELEEKEK